MALDSRLALGAQGIDGLAMFENANKIAGVLDQQKTARQLATLYKQAGGDLSQMAELGKQSPLAHLIVPQIQAKQAEQAKAAIDQQKTLAEIGKITADSTAASQKATIDRNKAINSSLAAALSGNPAATSFMLDHAKAGGMLDDSTYNSAKQYLAANANNPEAISALVKSLGTAGAENPEQYLMPDANNVNTNATSIANNTLDNQTSENNNIRTTNASIQNNVLDNDTSLQNNQLNNATSLANNQLTNQTSSDNNVRTNETGLAKSAYAAQAKSRESIAQRMERQATALKASQASQAAATAAQKAADLINHPGIDSGTGLTSAFGLIPSTDAKRFQTDLENLKAQLFLPTIQQMKGMGALSNAEGMKVEAAVQNLDPKIGPDEMRKRLSEVAKGMAKLADVSRQEARIYASQGGAMPIPEQAGGNTGQPAHAGKVASFAAVKQAAKQAGMSVEQMVATLKNQGITVQ